MPLKLTIESRAVQQDLAEIAIAIPTLALLEIILDQVGADVVEWLRSYTNEWRPPARSATGSGTTALYRVRDKKGGRSVRRVRSTSSGGRRRAHPGHWADVTGDLKEKYGYRVIRSGGGVQLELYNESDHAVYVEAMDGYFVVKGITDPGGPIDQRLRVILPKIAPGWKVV